MLTNENLTLPPLPPFSLSLSLSLSLRIHVLHPKNLNKKQPQGDYICSEPSLTEFCKNTKTLGFLDDLQNSSDIWTVFAPANEAFDESASRAINSFLTTTSTDARKVLAFHHVNGESLSYDDLVCKETIEMYLPNSFSRTKCEKMQGKDGSKNEEMKYQVGSGNSIVGIMPMITSSAQCDNGFIHIVDGILLPKPANLAAAYETGDEVISGGGDLIKDLIFGPSSQTAFQFNNLITEVEVERLELDNPNVVFGDLVAQEDAAAKAAKCLNLMNMEVDYSSIPEKYSCLPAYCESITTVEDCQSAFYKGCSFCAGQCVAAAGMQAAVIKCIREAWKDAAPNSVNGAVPDGDVIPSEEEIIFHNMAGLSELKNVIGGARSVMSWGIYQDKRPKNYRVPIHVHPLGGYTCVNDGPVEMIVQVIYNT